MLSSSDILSGLFEIANRAQTLAVLWHVAFGAAIFAFVLGWRPTRRTAALLACLPLASVAVLAWTFGNPFNGSVFAVLAAVLAAVAVRLPPERVDAEPAWARIAGGVLLAFGWTYPHFLEAAPAWRYLYAAPLGLLPCPTLSAIIGLTLFAGGFGSRAWSLVLAIAGLFYGLFGALRLGVWLDLVLLIGTALLVLLPTVELRRLAPGTR